MRQASFFFLFLHRAYKKITILRSTPNKTLKAALQRGSGDQRFSTFLEAVLETNNYFYFFFPKSCILFKAGWELMSCLFIFSCQWFVCNQNKPFLNPSFTPSLAVWEPYASLGQTLMVPRAHPAWDSPKVFPAKSPVLLFGDVL